MSSGKVVPSLPNIQTIQDPAARAFANAVTEILLVRQGDKGSGDNAYLTKADLNTLIGTDNFNMLTAGANQNAVSSSGRRLLVRDAIRDLQRQIAGSPLSIYLAETIGLIKRPKTGVLARIDTIDVQFAETNDVIAAIQTQQTTLTNDFAATAILVNTIQSRIDNVDGTGSAVTIEQRFLTLVNKDNFLIAQYTVKIDLNGYIVGFGLLAIDNGAGPSSLFLIRADRFAIGAPGLNAQIPFIVDTSDHFDVNGVHHPNGAVYIEDGMFGKFIADEGNIGRATIGTLKIQDEAVTVPYAVNGVSGTSIPFQSFVDVCSVGVDFTDDFDGSLPPTRVYIHGMVQVYTLVGGPNTGMDVRLLIDGAVIPNSRFGQSFNEGFGGTVSSTAIHLTSGAHTISFQIQQGYINDTPYFMGESTLLVMGIKK